MKNKEQFIKDMDELDEISKGVYVAPGSITEEEWTELLKDRIKAVEEEKKR